MHCDVEKDTDKIKCLLINYMYRMKNVKKKSPCLFEKYSIFNNCWPPNFMNFSRFHECLLLSTNECENKFLVFMA